MLELVQEDPVKVIFEKIEKLRLAMPLELSDVDLSQRIIEDGVEVAIIVTENGLSKKRLVSKQTGEVIAEQG